MVAFAELDIAARTESLRRAKADMDGLTVAASRLEDQAQDAAVAVSNTGRGMNLAGGGARMLTQQLSQVGQQTMATGNFIQALAIQLPDIGLAFGAVGTAVGLLAGVALPILVSALGGAGSSAKDLKSDIESLSDTVSAYKNAVDEANLSTSEMRLAFGDATFAVGETLNLLREIAAGDAQDAIDNVTASLAALMGTAGDGEARAELASFFDVNIMIAFTDAQRTAREEARLLTSQFQEQQAALAGAEGNIDAQISAMSDLLSTTRQLANATDGVNEEERALIASMRDALGAMVEQKRTMGEVKTEFERAKDVAVDLFNTAASSDWLSGAISKASTLAETLWGAARAAAAAVSAAPPDMAAGGLAAQYAQYGAGRVIGERAARESGALYGGDLSAFRAGAGNGGGSGGGGVADNFKSDLEALVENMQTERETIDAWYEEGQLLLADRRAMEILGEEGHREALLRVEEEYQQRLREIKETSEGGMLTEAANYFGELYSLSSNSLGKLAKLQKVAAQGQLLVDQVKAVSAIWGDASIPWYAKGLALLKVGAVFAGLKSTLGGGGGGRGAGIGGGRDATAAPEQQQRIVRLDVRGEGMFADMLRKSGAAIVDAITNEQKFGGTTIVMGR